MPHPFHRRHFLKTTAAFSIGIPFMASATSCQKVGENSSIQEVIDLIVSACGDTIPNTVDTVKSSDPAQTCSGIVCTFLATSEVIKQAIELGANLIITHEPTYYNHRDETDWLENDPVYKHKRALLEEHGIVVWRFHDYWHQHQPDGILEGFLETIGWKEYVDPYKELSCEIPAQPMLEVARHFKASLQLKRTFYVGDPAMEIKRIGLLPGAWGREKQIEVLRRKDLDAIAVGEIAEWETCEWVRDANAAGIRKGLIILGHADSEEPGMRYLVDWLQPRVKGITVSHIAAEDPFIGV